MARLLSFLLLAAAAAAELDAADAWDAEDDLSLSHTHTHTHTHTLTHTAADAARSLSSNSSAPSLPLLSSSPSCAESVAAQFNCSEPGCADLVPGYINYIEWVKCSADNDGVRFLMVTLLLAWMAFLLHLVETTTNNYFCASLTLAVDILKLSPNVAGVTFLAVGNAACDVIASIAAFATGVPKVGVGTTVGAGIFVTTAVIAAVSFVADVRLARRSFVRDVVFFILTIVYLLITTLDGVITVAEAVGFMIIYIVFVAVVASARFIRMLREEKEPTGFSVAGSTGTEGDVNEGDDASRAALVAQNSYNAVAPAPAPVPASPAVEDLSDLDPRDAKEIAERRDMLAALDAARRSAMASAARKEVAKVAAGKYFAPAAGTAPAAEDEEGEEEEGEDDEDDDGDGDLGGGTDDGRRHSVIDDLPKKPSRWTRQFLKTQHKDATQYAPFQWSSYHKKNLAKELAARLRARGASTVTTADGRVVDFLELLARDPKEAAEIAAAIGSSVSAAAVKHDGAITYKEATSAAIASVSEHGGVAATPGGTATPKKDSKVVVPVADVIALLPHETIKPIANLYVRVKRVVGVVTPYYHKGTYRRRLVILVMPGCLALLTVILTTHILKGTATSVGGFPFWLLAAMIGGVCSVGLHFLLPKKGASGDDGSRVSLLAGNARVEAAHATTTEHHAHDQDEHGHAHHRPWYKRLGIWIAGPNDEPLPTGILMGALLLLSFVMSLFWLLLIANEIVGVALFLGKIANVPDVVMGLTVLAVGNSINDLAASLTIARDGYASMAVAGAYAGPMFNVLAGIGLPMMIYTIKAENKQYEIGKDTPLVWASFITLLVSLTVTLVWVPLEGWRITHRIGRFLCAWFFMFILLVIIMGFGGLSEGDNVSLAG